MTPLTTASALTTWTLDPPAVGLALVLAFVDGLLDAVPGLVVGVGERLQRGG